VIIADTRSSMVAADSAAAVACAFELDVDVDFDFLLAQRATIGRGRIDPVKCGARAPGNLARKRLENGALAPGKA